MPTKGSEFIVKFQDIALPKDLETRIAARIQAVVAEELANSGSVLEKTAKAAVVQFNPILWRGKWIMKAAMLEQLQISKSKLQAEVAAIK